MFLQDSDKYKMDNNLDKVAKDLYGKIQTRFPNIKIGDENAQVLSKKSENITYQRGEIIKMTRTKRGLTSLFIALGIFSSSAVAANAESEAVAAARTNAFFMNFLRK